MEPSENWSQPQNILVILAHPDDPEFFCGAALARWVSLGHRVSYCLLTNGNKGASDRSIDPAQLTILRQAEQKAAASILGVQDIRFLDYEDGYLTADLSTRKTVTRIIRQERPDILVTCDPTNLFPRENMINHPDHRAAGQVVLDAVFPAAGNPFYFPDLITEEHLEPHSVKEVWLSVTAQPNTTLDATNLWPIKIRALHEHRSQIGEVKLFDERMLSRRTPDSTPEAPRFEEKFRRIIFG
jgi:LmbE family N-acetylglucosaminyl deacetylase